MIIAAKVMEFSDFTLRSLILFLFSFLFLFFSIEANNIPMKIWASNEESSFVSTVSKPPFWLSVSLMRSHPLPLPWTLGSQYFPFYRHQSVWRRDTTARVVSPGVGHEFVKLESCLFLFSPSPSSVLHFPRFPPFFFSSIRRDKGTIEFLGIFGRIRRYVTIYYFFQFQFSIVGDRRRRGKKYRAICFRRV